MSQALDDLEKESGDIRTALKDHDTRKRLAHLGVSIFVGEQSYTAILWFDWKTMHTSGGAETVCTCDTVNCFAIALRFGDSVRLNLSDLHFCHVATPERSCPCTMRNWPSDRRTGHAPTDFWRPVPCTVRRLYHQGSITVRNCIFIVARPFLIEINRWNPAAPLSEIELRMRS